MSSIAKVLREDFEGYPHGHITSAAKACATLSTTPGCRRYWSIGSADIFTYAGVPYGGGPH